jgi:hypothetical protein
VESPSQFLYIIHDKIDHTKTAIPRMQRITKATLGLGQIPILLTGMLTHGHGNGAYVHNSTAPWPRVVTRTFSDGRTDGRPDDRTMAAGASVT